MLAFQQIRLFGSTAWPRSAEVDHVLHDATARVLRDLLSERPRDYYFGYFCYEANGREHVLVRVSEDGVTFPLAGFRSQSESMQDCIDTAISQFIFQNALVRTSIIDVGYSRPEVISISSDNSLSVGISTDGLDIAVAPYFVKVKLNGAVDLKTIKYRWMDKLEFLNPESGEQKTSNTKALISALKANYISQELGQRVLNCVDILVFREHEGEYQFLMLLRRKPGEQYGGWEYPKGGLESHETIREGAIRELLEETGISSTGGFRFGGYLGYQTADVSWRNEKQYDTLRAHGVTYLFYGRPEDIKLDRKEEGHIDYAWMSWEEARKNLWIGEYGRRFLDRWHEQRHEILRRIARPISLAWELTEECSIGCLFCHRRLVKEPDATLEQSKEIIDILAGRGILRLTFTGGEPTLPRHKEATLALIEYAHSKRIHTCLSTTGIGLQKADIERLSSSLDQLLISLHNTEESVAPKLYEHEKIFSTLKSRFIDILQWTQGTGIKLEVCTVVSRANIGRLIQLGEWLFSLRPDLFWRLDEYYANGEQAGNRAIFEVPQAEFAEQKALIEATFSAQVAKRQVRFNTKESRLHAPDLMITPQGKFVTSSDREYAQKGEKLDLLYVELKNRRPWAEYRDCIRTDWKW